MWSFKHSKLSIFTHHLLFANGLIKDFVNLSLSLSSSLFCYPSLNIIVADIVIIWKSADQLTLYPIEHSTCRCNMGIVFTWKCTLAASRCAVHKLNYFFGLWIRFIHLFLLLPSPPYPRIPVSRCTAMDKIMQHYVFMRRIADCPIEGEFSHVD